MSVYPRLSAQVDFGWRRVASLCADGDETDSRRFDDDNLGPIWASSYTNANGDQLSRVEM
jgi:hypothetical protein